MLASSGMSAPVIKSLASIVDSQAAPVESAPAPPSIPSLQAVIDTTTPSSTSPVVPVEKPAQDSQPVQASSAESQQQQAILRQLLSQRGLTIPETYQTDDQIADALVAEFDAASAAQNTPEFRAFLAWQAQQQAAPQPVPVPPKSNAPAPNDLLNAIRTGVLTHDAESKKWTSAYPQFAHFADAMNEQDARATQAKISLASDPESFIKQQLQDALATVKPQGEIAELKQLLQEIRQEREAAQSAQVEAWVTQNAAKLYLPGSKNLAPYGQAYQTIESTVQAAKPNISPLERHNEVLRQLAVLEQAFRPAAPAASAIPTAPAAPKQSFLAAAGQRNGANRLSEYAGPAANSVTPQVPRGKGGAPSLAGLINQQTALTSN